MRKLQILCRRLSEDLPTFIDILPSVDPLFIVRSYLASGCNNVPDATAWLMPRNETTNTLHNGELYVTGKSSAAGGLFVTWSTDEHGKRNIVAGFYG